MPPLYGSSFQQPAGARPVLDQLRPHLPFPETPPVALLLFGKKCVIIPPAVMPLEITYTVAVAFPCKRGASLFLPSMPRGGGAMYITLSELVAILSLLVLVAQYINHNKKR